MDQSLSSYRIFYEVARTENISRAAKELYISQPAISKSISKLEDSLNVPLFVRSSRGAQLTEEGRVLYEHVRAAFEQLDMGEQEIHRIHTLGIGQIRFGVSTTLCKYILVPYLKDFIPMNPHIRINILSQSTMKTLDLLEQRQIDIGLVAEPKNLNDLEFFPVTEIEDGFVVSKNYLENLRLREHTDVMDAGILEIGNIMLLDRQNITRKFIEAYFSEHHIEPAQVLEVPSMDLLIEFARIGLGIGCVIKDFVKEDLACKNLVEIPLTPPLAKRTIGFVYRKNTPPTRAMHAFISFYRDKFPNIPPSERL